MLAKVRRSVGPVLALLTLAFATNRHLPAARAGSEESNPAAEAQAFYALKRAPVGQTAVPSEGYATARQRADKMNVYSTASGTFKARGGEVGAANVALGASWSSLGPGNIGGRTRAIAIDPNGTTWYAAGVAGGVFRSTNSGGTWTPMGDSTLTNMAVTSLALKPGTPTTILAGTGESFTSSNNMGFSTPTGDNVRGAGIFKSTDSGATWTQLSGTSVGTTFGYYVNDIVWSSVTNMAYAATSNGVWRSLDGGATWTHILTPTSSGACTDLALDPAPAIPANDWLLASCGISGGAQSVYLAKIAQTAATIANWSVTLTELQMGRTTLAFGPAASGGVAYAMSADKTSGALYSVWKSSFHGDSGAGAWSRGANTIAGTTTPSDSQLILEDPYESKCNSTSVAQGAYDNVLIADPSDSTGSTVWAGGVDLFKSTDSGVTFQPVSTGIFGLAHYLHANQHAVVFNPVGGKMIVGNDGGVFEMTTAGGGGTFDVCPTGGVVSTTSVFTSRDNGYSVTQFNSGAVFPDDATYLGGAQGNGTVKGTDAGGPNAWTQFYRGGEGGNVSVDPTNTNSILISNKKESFRKSNDGGATFASNSASSLLWNTGISDADFLLVAPLVTESSNAQRLWTAGRYLWRSEDQADTWTKASAQTTTSVSAIAVAPTDPNFVLAGTQAGVIHRTSIGLSSTAATIWSSVTPRAGYVSSIAIDPNNSQVAYASYSTFTGIHVYKSINGGVNWTDADGTGVTGIPDIPVHSIAIDPNNTQRIYAGTDLGVYVSLDAGATWSVENTGFGKVVTEKLVVNGANLYAFTHGRGVWRVALRSGAAPVALDFTTSRTTVTEGAAPNVVLTVILRTADHLATSSQVTVNYATADGTAVAPGDYTATSGILTFAAGTAHGATQTITVPIINDNLGEGTETFTASLSGATTGVLLGQALHTITIKPDGDLPGFSINDVTVGEGTATATFTVTLAPTMASAVTVNYATANNTATAGADYTVTSGVLTFPANTATKTFTVPILNDTVAEPTETFFVNLTGNTGATQINDAQGICSINDNDVSGTIQFSAANYTVTEAGLNATITVTRTGGTATGVSVQYQTSDGTATAGSDYTTSLGSVTFGAAGSATFKVPITSDTLDDDGETINLQLLTPLVGYGAVLGAQTTAVLTITDDDVAGNISFSAATYSAMEGNSALITVKRAGGAASGVMVNYATSDGSAIGGGVDYTTTSGTLTFNFNDTSKTFSVPLIAESPILVEGDETVNLTLSGFAGGAVPGAITSSILTIKDGSPAMTFAAASTTVGESALTVTLNVSRTGPTNTVVTVPYSTADGTAKTTTVGADPLDYVAASGTLTFGVGVITKPITITLKPDTVDEGVVRTQDFTVNLGTPSGGILGANPTETVNINDDDHGGAFEFSASSFSVNEPLTAPGTAAAKATITVKRTAGTASGATVHWSTPGGGTDTATPGTDYTASSGTLTFNAGIASLTFTVSVLPDDVVEGYETFGVALDTPTGGATLGPLSTSTVTIVDSEPVVQFSAATLTVSEGVVGGKATVSLKRTGSLAGALTVNLTTAGSGVNPATYGVGGDYNNVPATVTMPANIATKTFTFDVLQDTLVEPTETLSLTVVSCTGAAPVLGCNVGPQASIAVSITDDEPVITWSLAATTVGEAVGTANLTLKRTGTLAGAVDVTITVTGGTALLGTDYTVPGAASPFTVTMPAAVATKVVPIGIVNDTIGEPSETAVFKITSTSSGSSTGTLDTTTLTITDNEPTISFSAPSYAVAEPSNTAPNTPVALTITVKRAGTLTQTSTVDYTIGGGTATLGADYSLTAPTAASGTLTFASGVASMTLNLSTLHDTIHEGSETIPVVLSNVTGAKLGAALPATLSATVTITDND